MFQCRSIPLVRIHRAVARACCDNVLRIKFEDLNVRCFILHLYHLLSAYLAHAKAVNLKQPAQWRFQRTCLLDLRHSENLWISQYACVTLYEMAKMLKCQCRTALNDVKSIRPDPCSRTQVLRAEPARPLLTLSLACSLTLTETVLFPSLNRICSGTEFYPGIL